MQCYQYRSLPESHPYLLRYLSLRIPRYSCPRQVCLTARSLPSSGCRLPDKQTMRCLSWCCLPLQRRRCYRSMLRICRPGSLYRSTFRCLPHLRGLRPEVHLPGSLQMLPLLPVLIPSVPWSRCNPRRTVRNHRLRN